MREVISTFSTKHKKQSSKFRKAFHFDIVDNNSETIRVVAFDAACHKHFKNVKVGELCKISGFVIRFADPAYNNLEIEYELELTVNSIVCPVTYLSPDNVTYASLPETNFQDFSTIDSAEVGQYIGK